MDIYSYLNSPDVAEHCRKLNHPFNALESAFIVNDCRSINIEEKHRLYSEIIKTMPDVTIQKHLSDDDNDPSFFNHLRKEIEREKSLLLRFMNGENNAVYTFSFYDPNDEDHTRDDVIYSSYKNAIAAVKKHQTQRKRLYTYLITMKKLDQEDWLTCILNNDLDICFIQTTFERLLDQFWVYIPTPFQKGDLLCGVGGSFIYPVMESNRAMVLTELASWNSNREPDRIERLKKSADSSDMTAYGYWLDRYGEVYFECIHAYHNLRYYRGDLQPKDIDGWFISDNRLLKAIGSFLKGEIEIDMLISADHVIEADRRLRHALPHWNNIEENYGKCGIGDTLKIKEYYDNYKTSKGY